MLSSNRPIIALALTTGALPALAQECSIDAIFVGQSLELVVSPSGVRDEIASGDIDGDGDLDIVVNGLDNGSAVIYLNDGTGGLVYSPSPLQGVSGGSRFYTALADFDNNGTLDLAGIRGGSDGNDLVIYPGNGDGTFGPLPSTFNPEFSPSQLFTADVDADGSEDIIALQSDAGLVSIIVYRNAGNGTFTDARIYGHFGRHDQARAGDLDGDGFPEIVTTNREGATTILRNQGDGTFLPHTFTFTRGASTAYPPDVRLADLNGDGHLDIAYSIYNRDTGGTFFTLNNGAGNFQDPATEIEDLPSEQTFAIQVLDADGDGDNDIFRIITGGTSFSDAVLLRNDGNATFTERSLYVPVPYINATVLLTSSGVGDYNGDGTPDMLVHHYSGVAVGVWFNTCFTQPVIGQQPLSIIAAQGEPVTFSVSIESGSTPLTYQWRREGVDLTDGAGIAGANSPNLTITGVTPNDEAFYDCVVSNSHGARTSARALLAVSVGAPACPADLDMNTVLNIDDVLTFLSAFASGCP